ncbi:GntR family transcriptional regulator [Curvibacter sp. CHRR-16]|uniref:GntR family transcriptional regulator n=1 Tax=Curvibacter sp. CHRR-16 TaxID=2835872 RepID=UPI001BDB1844|nr:GntR family transcriptional regulator [Curvibacter sp. CHRR-16]MBT0571804.1 GntR family transcriptional regulator [Curvibacter sp. CHRR-16]
MAEAPILSENDIYERMVATILDHRLPPGTKLIEEKLATAFGVSRTRIRPVLVRLANEQIVTLTPNRGATVAQPTEQEAREVFEVRRMIEPILVRRFVRQATDASIATLTQCIDDEEQARERADMRRAIRLSGEFHLHIATGADHQTLGRILRELVSRTSLILMTYSSNHMQGRPEATACGCTEHRALLDAIRLRDANAADVLMQQHLRQLEAQLQFGQDNSNEPDLEQLFKPE